AHGGCIQSFFVSEAQNYDVRSDDWGDRGFFQACDLSKEFTKHWNAAWLIKNGLQNSTSPRTQFHHTNDYEGLAVAADNNYHDDTSPVATDDRRIFGSWSWRPFGANQVATSCLLYDASSPNANPASRGGDFVHEGWHGWLWLNWYWPDHQPGPQGACMF